MSGSTRPRICFVIPPSVFLLDERVFMSLGVLKVAAACEEAGYPVEVVDLSGVENYREAMASHVANSSSTIYGITATTPQMPAATEVIEMVRAGSDDAKIILGGPHPTLVYAAWRGEVRREAVGRAHRALDELKKLADVVVAGDGERAIFEAIAPNAPQIVDADDPASELFLTNEDLECQPLPARHLVDVDSYRYEIDGYRATSLIAQLGCPFNCGFCGGRQSPMLRRIRTRGTQYVIDELTHLHDQYGFRGFMFYDDELNVNKQVVELMREISALQVANGTDFRLRGFVKSELFTDEQAKEMYRAGFRWILVGFESGSPRILKNINKKATLQDNTRCVQIAQRNGLKVKALMSIGHPGETAQTIRETQNWLMMVQPDDFDVTIITTYPGTPYFDRATPHPEDEGVWTYTCTPTGDTLHAVEIDHTRTADYYKGDPDGGYRAFVYTDDLTPEDLVELRDKVERQVRASLGIPFNASAAKVTFEHSMGQPGPLPPSILRTSQPAKVEIPSRLRGRVPATRGKISITAKPNPN